MAEFVTVMHDIARMTELTVHLDETAVPVHPPVRAVCDMLGYDPLYLPCEGRVVAVLSAEDAPRALDIWRALPGGEAAAIIGQLNRSSPRSYCIPKSEANGYWRNSRMIHYRVFVELVANAG